MDQVTEVLFEGQTLTPKELSTVALLASAFRPWVPRARTARDGSLRPPSPCAALGAPLLFLGNAILGVMGLKKFQRSPCPEVSPATLPALQLNTVGLFEGLISRGSFQVPEVPSAVPGDPTHKPAVTSPESARMPLNVDRVWASFFDLAAIKSICEEHGLEFAHRLTFCSEHQVSIASVSYSASGHALDGWPTHIPTVSLT